MMGLEVEGRPLTRAYSVVSANYDDYLEFLSIKVPDGALTSRLQHVKEGDRILVGKKPTGTLVISNLRPGRNLYLLGTGTGLAPFMSIIRDPETYEQFEKVVLVHGCRLVSELAYGDRIMRELPADEYHRRSHPLAPHLFPDGHARAVQEPRPHHRAHGPTGILRGPRAAGAVAG